MIFFRSSHFLYSGSRRDKALDVTTVPHQVTGVTPKMEKRENATLTTFVESEFFSVYKWAIDGRTTFSTDDRYLLVSVINGNGTLVHAGERYSLKKGMHFILPVGIGEFELDGNAEFIVSHT